MNNESPLIVRPAQELLETPALSRRFILGPLIAPGTITLVYGAPGVGKSFLALGLALAAAGGGSFLGWTAPRRHNVFYLDGEMGAQTVAERLRLFGPPPRSLQVCLAQQSAAPLDLSTFEGLHRLVSSWGPAELAVIDSLSSVTGTVERDTERWMEFRRLLDIQRRKGRAIVLVHHANRDGAMRGISQRADAMDLILALRRPRDWRPSDGARFELRVEKARHQTGQVVLPIEAQLCTGPDGAGHWQWHQGGNRALRQAVPLLQQGLKPEAVAKAIGVSPRTGYRLQAQARVLGLIA